MGSEKFCLRWNDFEANISSSFSELRDDKDFFDVTLACDDEHIQAHKLIISACSPFFRNVLRKHPHQNPLLYLKGVRFTDLQAVLNFMYHGEVNVAQEDLNSFLAVAEDLRVKGLTQNQANTSGSKTSKPSIPQITDKEPPPKRPRPCPSQQQNLSRHEDDIQEVSIKSEPKETPTYTTPQAPPAPHPVVVPQAAPAPPQEDHSVTTYQEEAAYEEYEQYDEQQYEETNNTMDHITMPGKEPVVKTPEDLLNYVLMTDSGFQCSVCGKAFGTRRETRCHVESIHFKHSFTYYCDHCGKEFNSLNTRNVHISRNHKKTEKNW